MNLKLQREVKRLARELQLPERVVQDAFTSQFKFFRDRMTELDLSKLSEDEMQHTKTNFAFKYLGKFYTTYKRVEKITNYKHKKNIKNGESKD